MDIIFLRIIHITNDTWGSLVRYKYTSVYTLYRCILNVAGGQRDAVHEVIPSRQIFILFCFKFPSESGDVSFLNPSFRLVLISGSGLGIVLCLPL